MKIVMFYHSLVSDWNHGNAHFLRGVVAELQALGHDVAVYEPADGWSRRHLLAQAGAQAIASFHDAYPELTTTFYQPDDRDLRAAVRGADLVVVHEWNAPEVVARVGRLRRRRGFVLLFHDTHHRMVTEAAAMARYDLTNYDGVLAFGRVLRDIYVKQRLVERAWVWHEAADVRRFHPLPAVERDGDVVWIGNWGDDERRAELHEFLIEPVRALGLRATVYGVRYPVAARRALAAAGIAYRGWLPNFHVPHVFARHRVTLHVPRRPYVAALPGIPTIRPFEALACGIPLVSAPWRDVEGLFAAGRDLLFAGDGAEMEAQLGRVLRDASVAESLRRHGRSTILRRHTCAHRAAELLAIYQEITASSELLTSQSS